MILAKYKEVMEYCPKAKIIKGLTNGKAKDKNGYLNYVKEEYEESLGLSNDGGVAQDFVKKEIEKMRRVR